MDNQVELIQEVVVVGGGPVGNLCAVLASFIGAPTTVYEKRQTYTRQINLKIEIDLFKDISRVFQNIGRKKDDFFDKMHATLVQKDGKILLNNLQKTLKQKSVEQGTKYIMGRQIKTFSQVYEIHKQNNPLIIDATGRNSFLRVAQFGTDKQNMEIHDLHHALHINFDTVIPRDFDYRLIYSIITNTDDLKLGDIVVSKGKKKDKEDKDSKSVHVTIPLFISEKLSKVFDENYPNINRVPLKPFSYKKQDCIMQEDVQSLLYSIFCPFVMEDWDINWNSVVVKKINITCGFAVKRSKDRFVCVGDSAAHFAYFKSLNFGLKHAFELIKILSSYHGFRCKLPQFNEKQAIELCKSRYPPLAITQAKPGPSPSEYFIKTDAIVYSAFVFNVASESINKLDILPVFCVQKIPRLFNEYQQDCREQVWQKHLDKFEKLRDGDIDTMILSNRSKRNATEIMSYLIWFDGLNPMKFADFLNIATKGFALDKKDFDFFSKTFKSLKSPLENPTDFKQQLQKSTKQTQNMVSSTIPKQFHNYCNELIKMTENQSFSMQQFCKFVDAIKWDRNNYDYKRGTLFIKILELIVKIYRHGVSLPKDAKGK